MRWEDETHAECTCCRKRLPYDAFVRKADGRLMKRCRACLPQGGAGWRSEIRCRRCGDTQPAEAFRQRERGDRRTVCLRCEPLAQRERARAWGVRQRTGDVKCKKCSRPTPKDLLLRHKCPECRERGAKWLRNMDAYRAAVVIGEFWATVRALEEVSKKRALEDAGYRVCLRCNKQKSIHAFGAVTIDGKQGRRATCRRCRRKHERVADVARKARGDARMMRDASRWATRRDDYIARMSNPKAACDLTQRQWLAIVERHAGCCAYCGSRGALTLDHLQPLSRGGAHTAANVVPACRSCNSSKGALTLGEWLQRIEREREGDLRVSVARMRALAQAPLPLLA